MKTSARVAVDAVDHGLELWAPLPRQVCPRCGRDGAEEIHCWDCWERFVPARHARLVV